MKQKYRSIKFHILPLSVVLFLHLSLSALYTLYIPLGEAPDEPAHLSYIRFIAQEGRLPISLAEREAAGYRSAWPPLYHLLVAGPVAIVGDAPPTHLKSVGDTPRRLIPTNGHTIASYIHTVEEDWPWHGLPLAWHLGRLGSVMLTAFAVTTTYFIAWTLTKRRLLAAGTASLHGLIPQVLFIGSVLNDDNLLILLSSLIFLILARYAKRSGLPSLRKTFGLGLLLGLATVTKYNALPLWIIVLLWGERRLAKRSADSLVQYLSLNSRYMVTLLAGALLTSGWWFLFVGYYFNQFETLGYFSGFLAALTAGTSDASLRHLTTEPSSITIPSAFAWLEWFNHLFQTFWGSFGGGSTIDLPPWLYRILFVCTLLALPGWISQILDTYSHTASAFLRIFLLSPLFFILLPILRFILSGGNIVETAQGRHLYPALPAICLGLVWGLSRLVIIAFPTPAKENTDFGSQVERLIPYAPFSLLALSFSLYGLSLIERSYPPPIPLYRSDEAVSMTHPLDIPLTEQVTLRNYEIEQIEENRILLSLLWEAEAIPPKDYLIKLHLMDAQQERLGGWIGQPLGGRYPTRAWDKGDFLHHTIPIPFLSPTEPTSATLQLQLLDTQQQPITEPIPLTDSLSLSPSSVPSFTPFQLRADHLLSENPFTYRSTLSFLLPDSFAKPPLLHGPHQQQFLPAQFIQGPTGTIIHFIVDADWPSGDYWLTDSAPGKQYRIENRPRQFELPPMTHPLKANFGNTLTLLGYDLPINRVQPGQSFPLTLHWRAERPLGQNLTVFNHLLDQDEIQRGGTDRIPLKYYNTLLWVPGEIVSDAYQVSVDADAPPGIYWLHVGLYPTDQPHLSLPLFAEGNPIDQTSIRLGPIKVGTPPMVLEQEEIQPQIPLQISFGNQISLLGLKLQGKEGILIQQENTAAEWSPDNLLGKIQVASTFQLTFFWQAEISPPLDYTVFIHLLDQEGEVVAQFDGPPTANAYPTHLWDEGEIIADERVLTNLPAGDYTLLLGLYHPPTGERLPIKSMEESSLRLITLEVNQEKK